MKEFIDDFVDYIETTCERLKSISKERSEFKPGPEKWSPKEIIGHLIDSSINNRVRIVNGQFQSNLIFDGYEQNEWVRANNYNAQNWNYLVELWKLSNLHFAKITKEIPENILKKEFREHNFDKILFEESSKNGPATLELLIRDYVLHMKHHLNQIFS